MKKVSLLAALAMVSGTAVLAQVATPPSSSCPKAFQGFHLGGNIGFDSGTANQKSSTTLNTANRDTIALSNKLGVSGVDGGIGVGYTHRFGNWGLGLAFDANWANTKGKISRTYSNIPGESVKETLKARLRNSLQLYARAGYVIGGMAMPFVGLGWDNSAWKHSVTFADNINASNISKTKSKRYNALLWKAGVDFLATKHVVVGFDYTGTAAGKKDFTTTNAAGDTVKASFKPQNNKFALTAKIVY